MLTPTGGPQFDQGQADPKLASLPTSELRRRRAAFAAKLEKPEDVLGYGVGTAMLMSLVGKAFRVSAERAWALGMVDLLEDSAAAALARAHDLARAIATNSPQAVKLTADFPQLCRFRQVW